MAASMSLMPISLLIGCGAVVDSGTDAGVGTVVLKLEVGGCIRSSVISAALLQSSKALRASPDTAAT